MKYISHQEKIQKYVGSNVETLTSEWGAPQSTTTMPSGNIVYLFQSEKESQERTGEIRSESRGGFSQSDESIAVYSKVKKLCKTTVTVNKKGKVLSLNSQGDGCEGEWVKKDG